jgi:UDP-N-acetylglucosamine--N-acetylmuramyl-(pentapeptide) pyrophosphoryl-undecaprenol N-acetylglucosamine transferase
MSSAGKTLVVAGGGTGGHVWAGVAVADSWKQLAGADGAAVFVGAQGAIEEKLVPRSGYVLHTLRIGSLKSVSLARRLRTLAQLPVSLLSSAWLLLRLRPMAVLGVGGYASGPLVLMARAMAFLGLLRCQTAILEQNSVPGFTNRVLGRFVTRVFCAFPGMEARFRSQRVFFTGNPIRSSIRRMTLPAADPFTVFIFGGSQGAQGINSLVIQALPELQPLFGRLRFIHQTGERDFDRVAEAHRRAGSPAEVERFIYDMPAAYARAALVVCRSGSSTLSELAAVGRAAVLIPLPTASDNHQEVNARVYTDAGAALLLPQTGASGADLARLIRGAMDDRTRLQAMAEAVTRFHRPQAAQQIAQALLS